MQNIYKKTLFLCKKENKILKYYATTKWQIDNIHNGKVVHEMPKCYMVRAMGSTESDFDVFD